MTTIQPRPNIFLQLSEPTVAALVALREGDETLDAVVARCAKAARGAKPAAAPSPASSEARPSPDRSAPPPVAATAPAWPGATGGRYCASVLGAPVCGATLGMLARNVVDAVHDLDPAVIERLSAMRARKRRYVARAREDVHAGRRDLPLLQARSGWWVSANIGRDDLVRSLRALCRAGDLRYGDDIRFPA